jgi:hypothetical protein
MRGRQKQAWLQVTGREGGRNRAAQQADKWQQLQGAPHQPARPHRHGLTPQEAHAAAGAAGSSAARQCLALTCGWACHRPSGPPGHPPSASGCGCAWAHPSSGGWWGHCRAHTTNKQGVWGGVEQACRCADGGRGWLVWDAAKHATASKHTHPHARQRNCLHVCMPHVTSSRRSNGHTPLQHVHTASRVLSSRTWLTAADHCSEAKRPHMPGRAHLCSSEKLRARVWKEPWLEAG